MTQNFYKILGKVLLDRGQLYKTSPIGFTQKSIFKLKIWPKQEMQGSTINKFVHVTKINKSHTTGFYSLIRIHRLQK